ncbi:MAG: hypothetical protein HKP13_06775 [Gammaproteobacteria bacterium]|nr:hypothetical protein [Gammaproteobacteria bacterium]
MHRLQPLLVEGDSQGVEVDLWFGPNDSGHLGIQGRAWADLNLICQRCLKTVPFRAESEVRLDLVSAEDGQAHPSGPMASGLDPLMVEEGEAVALSDIIEDELLLVLPMASMHPEGACRISRKYLETEFPQDKRENPFAVLVVDKPMHSNHEE